MHFDVPQFIEVEDKVVGPLTLKQSLYLGAGGLIIFFLWTYFELWFFILLAIPVLALTLSLAFLKLNGIPFPQILLSWLGFQIKPRVYTWEKKTK